MKLLLSTLFILSLSVAFSQSIEIDSEDPINTPQQLIEEVLVEAGSCAWVEYLPNETSIYDTAGDRSFGYFSNTNSDFPFENGIILSSGFVSSAQAGATNEPSGSSDTTTNASNAVLESLNPLAFSSNDASVVTFRFKTANNHISFNYLFASEEYEGGNDWPCSGYSDTFAFIISGPGIDNTNTYQLDASNATTTDLDLGGKNIALIPGTNIPVSATNVFEATNCTGQNTEYYNSNWGANFTGTTEFNGHTSVFSAESDVVPNEWYTMRLIIGDANDNAYDSAVFLEAYSLNISNDISLPDDFIIANQNAICNNNSVTLEVPLYDSVSYQWYFNGSQITGATSNIYQASSLTAGGLDTGNYAVEVDFSDGGSCIFFTDIQIEFVTPPILPASIDNYYICDTDDDGFATFDFTTLNESILNGQDSNIYTVAYYLSQDDYDNNNPITTPIDNDIAYTEQNVMVQIYNNQSTDCDITTDFVFAPVSLPIANPISLDSCQSGIELTNFEDEIINGQIVSISYYDTIDDANVGENALTNTFYAGDEARDFFYRLENANTCFAVGVISINILFTPLANPANDMAICNSGTGATAEFDLASQSDDIINGQTAVSVSYYETMDDAEADTNALPSLYTNITSPQTIYARITGDLGGCNDITTFTITASEVIATDVALGGCSPSQGSADGVYELTNIEDEVINGQTGITATYYTSLADASAANNELTDTLYEGPSQNFYVRLENELGCYDIAEIILSVQPSPMVNAQTQEFLVCNEGNGIGIFNLQEALDTATGTQDDIMYATLHQSQEDANQNIAAINTEDVELTAQTLYVRLENTNGCTSYGSFNIEIENCPPVIPEAFSPNGDGANDVFTIHKLKTIYTEYKLSIYNRWGNLVYEGGDADAFWDGTIDNALITSDNATGTVYFYVLELNDGVHEPMKGTIYVNP